MIVRAAVGERRHLLPVEPALVVAHLEDRRTAARHDRPALELEALAGDAARDADQLVVDDLGVDGHGRAADRECGQTVNAG